MSGITASLRRDLRPNAGVQAISPVRRQLSQFVQLGSGFRKNRALNKAVSLSFSYDKSGYSVNRAENFREQDLATFVQANRDLLHIVKGSESLQTRVRSSSIQNRDDFAGVIAAEAHSLLSAKAQQTISEQSLAKNILLSGMIVLNTASLRDRINADDDVAALFSGSAPALTQETFEGLAELTANQFESGSVLNDKDFFIRHPDAAIILLSDRNTYKSVTVGTNAVSIETEAKRFKQSIDHPSVQAGFDDRISALAQEAVASGTFPKAFFSNNQTTREFIVAQEYLATAPSAAQILRATPQRNFDNKGLADHFGEQDFLKDIVAAQAESRAGTGLNLAHDFFRSQIGLSRLINSDESFRQDLLTKKNMSDVQLLAGQRPEMVSLSRNASAALREGFKSRFPQRRPRVSVIV